MQTRHGQGQGQVEIVVQGGEIGGQHQLQPRRGQGEALIGADESGAVSVVEVQRQAPITSEHNTAGTLIGAVVGGVLGNQVGGGNGKKVATAAGILAGGYTGNRIQDNQQRSRTYTTTELQCSTVYDTRSETTGYTVTYLLGDERGSVRMDHRPGDTLPVRDGQVVIR